MENNEVLLDTVDTPVTTPAEVTSPEVEVAPPEVEVTPPEVEVTEPIIPEEELNSLMAEIMWTTEKNQEETPKEEEKPKEEEIPKEEESEDIITDQDLEELDNIITDLEKQVTEKDTTISELNNEITTIKTDLEKYSNDYKTLEDWLNKISEHPILWPLAIKLVQWEEVNIPDYLMKAVESDLEAIPKLDWIETQSKPESLQDPRKWILAWLNLSYK